MMKASVQEAYEAAVGNPKAYEQHFELGGYLSKFEKWNDTLASLTPHTPQQTELLSSIRSISASFQQTSRALPKVRNRYGMLERRHSVDRRPTKRLSGFMKSIV